MRNRYYKDEFFGNLASDYKNHVVYYNNIEKYYKHVDHKREVVRHFITWIEATLNYMTEYLIKVGNQNPSLFNSKEMRQLEANWNDGIIKLSSKRMTIIDKISFTIQLFSSDRGQSNLLLPKRMDFANKFKFTFKLFASYHNILPIYKDYIGKYFENLLKVVAIRNKFTHPRKESDLDVSKLDFDMANQSYKDYYDFQIKFFTDIFYEDREE